MLNKEIYITWTELKAIVADRKLSLQYREEEYKYSIFAVDSNLVYTAELWTDTSKVKGIDVDQNNLDITDFEDNYQSDANKEIEKTIYKDGKGIKILGKATVTGTDQTILEYTVPEDTTIYITDIIVGGTEQDLKVLKKDSTKIWRAYHTSYDNAAHPFSTPIKVQAGKVIKVINKVATSGTHIATLLGVKVNG